MATLPYGGKEPATDETGEQYASEQSESCNTTAISSKAKLSDEAIASHTAVNISARIPDQPSEQTQETNQPTGRDHRSNALQHLRITAPNLHDLLNAKLLCDWTILNRKAQFLARTCHILAMTLHPDYSRVFAFIGRVKNSTKSS